MVREASKQGYHSNPLKILRAIRQPHISLHQGLSAAALTKLRDPPILFRFRLRQFEPSLYPLCDIASHCRDSLLRPSPSGTNTALWQVEQLSIAGFSFPSDPTTPIKIGDGSQAPATTEPALPVHTSSYPTDASPLADVLPDIPSAAALPHTLQGSTQQDIVPTCTASAADPMLPPPVASFSIPTLPPSSHVLPSTNTELLVLLSSTKRSLPTGNGTLPRLRARGLVNSEGMCFANSILQLLLHSPPFWNLFRKLGDLKRQPGTGGPEGDAGATPLVDATVRFFEEFMFKESPPKQQPLQQDAREGEEQKEEQNAADPIEPTYLYDAMKEKRWLKDLLVRARDQDASFYY